MLLTEDCETCKEMIMSMHRYGCRICEDGKPTTITFCSEQCVNMHKIDEHPPMCCGIPMQYDPGQPMSREEPDIAPEFYCECGATILVEEFLAKKAE